MSVFVAKLYVCVCTVKKSKGPVIGFCVAQYDYEATATNQISLREGDCIPIVSKAGEATGWWKGSKNGRVKSQTVMYQLPVFHFFWSCVLCYTYRFHKFVCAQCWWILATSSWTLQWSSYQSTHVNVWFADWLFSVCICQRNWQLKSWSGAQRCHCISRLYLWFL